MTYPILSYGHPILKERANEIPQGSDVKELVENMLTTMVQAGGVGLAGPQVGQSLRLFVADLSPFFSEQADAHRKVFINPVITIDPKSPLETYDEGCLSIPGVPIDIARRESLTIAYFDENWQAHEVRYTDMPARVIQHEYDHLEGKLITDYLTAEQKESFTPQLEAIQTGQLPVAYSMKFLEQVTAPSTNVSR